MLYSKIEERLQEELVSVLSAKLTLWDFFQEVEKCYKENMSLFDSILPANVSSLHPSARTYFHACILEESQNADSQSTLM